ncbi:hypothetical protein E0Z10_g9198 [Xylaria hypoxylon]|uniref:14-3-3 domain-containing protein n=1 Tax=Xylaria hypoxylon TaxID=37992 RepID=A0A4Z0Y6X9_9PEZI|nr:hypothetical protein E0Z10_g9198 [Xylaria hypoxylon]
MASFEVDRKFLGKLAKQVEPNNALLASMLFKILGLSINLAEQTAKVRKQRKLDTPRTTQLLELYFHIVWLSREGLIMLEQYVLPMVGDHDELKVLAVKLRASFYHVFVLFHNNPSVSTIGISTPIPGIPQIPRLEKGKGVDRNDAVSETGRSSVQPTHPMEGGPVGPPPGFGPKLPEPVGAFLLPSVDYRPTAHEYFKQAATLADSLLWGSHSLRLSVKTEYAAFLYECLHDQEGSRILAKNTISEVYDASEGMDDDMFHDACDLVTVLGKMMKRGLESDTTHPISVPNPDPLLSKADTVPRTVPTTVPAAGMENFI